MTTTELDALPPGSILFLPTLWDVQVLTLSGRVFGSDYFVMASISDLDGTVLQKRPAYFHALDLLPATQCQAQAVQAVIDQLREKTQLLEQKLATP